jgi:predicted phage gp36 major capsid-like protein
VCFIIFKIYNTAKKDKQIISEEKKAKLVQELAGRKEALLEELVSLLSMDYVDRKRQERNSESKVGESEDAIMEDLAELEKINAQKSTLENRLKEGKESRRARLLTETLRESITGGGGGGDDGTPKRSKGRAVTGGSRRTAGRSPISRRGRPDDMDLEHGTVH